MDVETIAAIEWPGYPNSAEARQHSSNEHVLASAYVALLAAAMAQPAQNVRSAGLAAMGAFVDRVTAQELSTQLPALLPCVLSGMVDLKVAEIRRLSIAAAAKLLALLVRGATTAVFFRLFFRCPG